MAWKNYYNNWKTNRQYYAWGRARKRAYYKANNVSYKKRFTNYYSNKKRAWGQKLASYQKGRLKGILWGFLFAFLLIPAIIYVVKNRQSIIATFKNLGGK